MPHHALCPTLLAWTTGHAAQSTAGMTRLRRNLPLLAGLLGLCCGPTRSDSSRQAATPGGVISWSLDRCEPGVEDHDRDGLDDRCEDELAAAFAPELRVDPSECGFDRSVSPARPGGEYLYAVQRSHDTRQIRIAYLPAYYVDCGWSGPKCALTSEMCEGHTGDSEFMIVELGFNATTPGWIVQGVFLSAHCHGRSDGRCRWYRDAALHRFQWIGESARRNGPVVWVARGSHAAYPGRGDCDTGFWQFDTCDNNTLAVRFPVRTRAQNLGSRSRPFMGASDCTVPGRGGWLSTLADASVAECFWTSAKPFRGWQRVHQGTPPTPYDRPLRERAGF